MRKGFLLQKQSKGVKAKSNEIKCEDVNREVVEAVKSDGGVDEEVQWDKETEEVFLNALKEVLGNRARKDLERRIRLGTGTEYTYLDKKKDSCGCSGPSDSQQASNAKCSLHGHLDADNNKISCSSSVKYPPFKRHTDDSIGGVLDTWVDDEHLRRVMGKVAERSGEVWTNVQRKGRAEGDEIPESEKKVLREEVLREALIREICIKVTKQLHHEHQVSSIDGGLYASPIGYKDSPLDSLLPSTIQSLVKKGYAIQSNYLCDSTKKILRDIDLRWFDGRFIDTNHTPEKAKYQMCWVATSDLDRAAEQGLYKLFTRMMTLPFELNKKANLLLQSCGVFRLTCYAENGGFCSKHLDGGYEENDVGRKITAIYYPNSCDWKEEYGGILRIHPSPKITKTNYASHEAPPQYVDILPSADQLVLLWSRDVPYEVTPAKRKCYEVSLLITGPPVV